MLENEKMIAKIVEAAGGTLVGRTRLQKTVYLLKLAGFSIPFQFEYHHYGPYSEDLTMSAEVAVALRLITETEKTANWGGTYSEYRVIQKVDDDPIDDRFMPLIKKAAEADSTVLEIAATAAFFAINNSQQPWEKTVEYKPDKTGNGRLERAKQLYTELRTIAPQLPEIPDCSTNCNCNVSN